MSNPPDPSTISSEEFSHLLELYPAVLKAVYASKIKDPKKLAAALEDDKWRYDGLPDRLKAGSGNTISKEDLQRLIQWKITHGTYRPFLPALIRKNDPEIVKATIQAAFEEQSTTSSSKTVADSLPESLSKALKTVSKLQGVGRATAPLLCSICDPVKVPFFEDELYAWLCPGKDKLKYNLKEYVELFRAARDLQTRLGVQAVEVEKVGYVVGHSDVLGAEQKADLAKLATRASVVHARKSKTGKDENGPEKVMAETLLQRSRKTSQPEKPRAAEKATKKRGSAAAGSDQAVNSEHKSKRAKNEGAQDW